MEGYKLRRSHFVPAAAVAAVVGASLAVFWPAARHGLTFWTCCSAVLALAVVVGRRDGLAAALLVSALLAMAYAAVNVGAVQQAQQHWHERAAQQSTSQLVGHVVGLPDFDAVRTRFVFREAASGLHLRMSWYDDAPALEPGQCWQLQSRLRGAHGSANLGGFDYEQWLFRERLAGSASVRAGEPCDEAQAARLDRLRSAVAGSIRNAASTQGGRALIPALVVGDRRGLTDEDWAALRRTGTSHLVAISGLHIGLLAVVGYGLGAWLWRRSANLCRRLAAPRAGAMLGLILAVAYAALSGFALPAQRALIMVAVFVASVWLGRGALSWHALGIAAIAVLLRDPLAPLSPGFWLSFGAVAWIILIARTSWFQAARGWQRWPLLQLGLSLGLLPLTALWFGEVSLLGPAVNFVLIPIFGVLVPLLLLASAALLVGVYWPLHLLNFSVAALLDALHAVGQLPTGALPLELSWPAATAVVAGLMLLVWGRQLSARVLGLLLLSPLLWPGGAQIAPGEARIDVFDVGQGLSVLVRTAGHSLLYDAGPAYRGGFDAGEAIVVPSLQAMGVRTLDRLVVSHGDGDHAGGVAAVRAAVPVGDVLGHGGTACRAGQSWAWDGVHFEILHPAGETAPGNNASCVMVVRTPSGSSALLPGDIERSAERLLLARGAALESSLLILPHHGSNSSSSNEFLQAVSPRIAVASAGYGNRWGFPTDAVRARVLGTSAKLLSTAHQGQLSLHLGERLTLQRAEREARPRVWRHAPTAAWITTQAQLSSTDD